jgi:hypothetical protein
MYLNKQVCENLHLAWTDTPVFHDYEYIEPRIVNVIVACFQIYIKII